MYWHWSLSWGSKFVHEKYAHSRIVNTVWHSFCYKLDFTNVLKKFQLNNYTRKWYHVCLFVFIIFFCFGTNKTIGQSYFCNSLLWNEFRKDLLSIFKFHFCLTMFRIFVNYLPIMLPWPAQRYHKIRKILPNLYIVTWSWVALICLLTVLGLKKYDSDPILVYLDHILVGFQYNMT